MDVGEWLRSLGLERYETAFRENEIDETVLASLTHENLKELGVTALGHRLKLLDAIAALRGDKTAQATAADVATTPSAPRLSPEDRAERRQVTVMFSDLVGSTALSARMDPEDLRELISAYQKCVVETVGRFGGFVAKFMGDGVLIYFGYPQAHEDDAERAVRAALELVKAVSGLKTQTVLQTRVGIATGLVVVGDLIGSGASQEQAIVGETPNLAARLQGIAEPNTVVIADSTRRLLGKLFELEDLGAQDLKGIAGAVRAWAALRPASVASRFEAFHASDLTALVGREEELDLLLRRWSKAKTGEGQVVLLSGEPGIGKSRLTAALLERLTTEPHTRLRYFCSPQHTDSAFFPIISQMERAAGLAHDDTAQAKLDKLDAVLAQTFTPREDAALFAEMLSLPNDGRYPALDLTPQQRRQRTLEALTTQTEALTRQNPVLMIFEDAHWTDPTSLEAFGRTVDRIKTLPALLIVTFRPEFNAPWVGQSHVMSLTLNRLGERETAAIIARLVGNKGLPADVMAEIVERTDGIPLFVEEMTKAVLEAESEGDARRTAAEVPSPAMAVPASLHASLMARLDRLGAAKEVAQIGAVIGREFSHVLLASVAGDTEADLMAALDQLIQAGLLFRQGMPPHATYVFKHALVQDAAYGTLLREPRRALHVRIAEALESQFAEVAENQPELLAHHYSRAGKFEKACQFWLLVADRSVERLAFVESVNALNFALRDAEQIADPAARASLKLDAQLRLGRSLVFQKGPQSNEAELAFTEAHRLAKEANAGPELFQSVWALYVNAARNRRYEKAKLRGDELLAISEELGDEDLKFEALHHRWGYAYFTGQTADMLALAAEGVRRYDTARHHRFAYTFAGHDAGVCAYCIRAMGLSAAGETAKIKPELDAALALSDRLEHPLSLLFARGVMCGTLYLTHDLDGCRVSANEMVRVATKYDLPFYGAIGSFWLGATQAMHGDVTDGLRRMEPAFEPLDGIGLFVLLPAVVMVDTLARAGRNRDALALIARVLDKMSDPKLGMFVSELWRIRGELIARERGGDMALAERLLQEALHIARGQEATLLQSRAGLALATHFAEHGRREEARIALAESGVSVLADRTAPEIVAADRLSAALS
jgi:class 3 adenylate cyclase